ncbi:hypothetical protein [Pajaroellobacter abortibovis]|uniref:Uncharacterized protein n=1 Tax=Pajaroellobacter abortibovis TaxID=1882918 RepID=A0A1L6MZF9_9BACT|nr:hypothetical protein [Pajaroellobacter abortibovis]APS00787.1 hypothetical protein BCY86_08925 [Pajaroellobacter abortibovis]
MQFARFELNDKIVFLGLSFMRIRRPLSSHVITYLSPLILKQDADIATEQLTIIQRGFIARLKRTRIRFPSKTVN